VACDLAGEGVAGEASVNVGAVGVGPWEGPWPTDPRFDPDLLAAGDARNVVDRYRYWTMEAIVADLDTRRGGLHVAVENWEHDFNIGAIVRTANAFAVAAVHIGGRRRWNRRGAMVTDRYQHIHHHPDAAALATWAAGESLEMIGIDNLPGSTPLDAATLPERCLMVFGQEGPGLTPEAVAACTRLLAITQYGSTRSLNAGAAAAIAMHAWSVQHRSR
jgi:tRNA G18 (ribose-2'-O)-methylase SpoU